MSGTVAASEPGCLGPEEFQPRHVPLAAQELPTEGEVHLWYLDIDQLAAPLHGALAADGETYTGELTMGQLRFVRRFYLRLLLGAYLGVPGKDVHLLRSVRGKPMLDRSRHDSLLQFSQAKSEHSLLVGISGGTAVGVDLEPADRQPRNALRLAERYFRADEAERLRALPMEQQQQGFLRAWALNEAVVKASGEGIANQLCRFSLEFTPGRPPAMLDFDGQGPNGWSLALVCPAARFLGAVALRTDRLSIRGFALQAAS